MYSTQSLLCPARASGLKSQGHLVPPTKKKKRQPRTPPAIKDDESWFLLEEKLLPGNHVQKTGAHHTPHVLWPACSHKGEHAFAGSSASTSSRRLGRLKRWEDRRRSKSTPHVKELEGNLMTKSSPILQASSSMSKLPPGKSEGPILCAFISH